MVLQNILLVCRHPSGSDNASRQSSTETSMNSPKRKFANRENVLTNTREDVETKNSSSYYHPYLRGNNKNGWQIIDHSIWCR